MRNLAIAALAVIALGAAIALGQNISSPALTGLSAAYNSSPPTCTNGNWCALQADVNGVLKAAASLIANGAAVSSANPLPVSGPSGAVSQSAVNVTNASTSVATVAQFANFGTVCVPQTAANGIWLNWAGVAAVTAPPSELLQPGECKSWVKTSGFMPTGAWAAISASASTIAITGEGN